MGFKNFLMTTTVCEEKAAGHGTQYDNACTHAAARRMKKRLGKSWPSNCDLPPPPPPPPALNPLLLLLLLLLLCWFEVDVAVMCGE